jgi:4-hydroxythreonine-4-phosphate dehydrogenase
MRLGLTAGDPAGIGPEIVAAAIADGRLPALGDLVVFAEPTLFGAACRTAGLDPLPPDPGARVSLSAVEVGPIPSDFAPGAPSRFTGAVAARSIEAAARAALAGEIDAIVTAPISKTALLAAGVRHPGHTEMLAELAGASRVAMMFVAGELRVTLATIHVPLARVAASLDGPGLENAILLTRDCLIARVGVPDPRIALLGVNPHASEGGRFGDEEARVLLPVIEATRRRGWRVEGPFPADSFFVRRRRDFDAVVAMYHDQGLIPVKLLSGGRAVNVTLGLPFLRTSVDHGTAFDIAGRGRADAGSLVEAARLAADWAGVDRGASPT